MLFRLPVAPGFGDPSYAVTYKAGKRELGAGTLAERRSALATAFSEVISAKRGGKSAALANADVQNSEIDIKIIGPDGQVRATPVAIPEDDPARGRLGSLQLLGGIEMDSADPRSCTLVLAVGAGSLLAWRALAIDPILSIARVQGIEGALYRVSGTRSASVAPGEEIPGGETFRTAKGSRATVQLADGSRVEMNERSELSGRSWPRS